MMTFFYFSNPLLRYFQEHFNCDIKSIKASFLSKCTTFFVLSSRSLRFLGHVQNQKYHKIKPNKYRVSQILKISYESYPDYWQDQAAELQACMVHHLNQNPEQDKIYLQRPTFSPHPRVTLCIIFRKVLKYKNVMSRHQQSRGKEHNHGRGKTACCLIRNLEGKTKN